MMVLAVVAGGPPAMAQSAPHEPAAATVLPLPIVPGSAAEAGKPQPFVLTPVAQPATPPRWPAACG